MNDDAPEQQFICDLSGMKFPASEMVRNWDGAIVNRRFRDIRNPQDFLRAKPDNQTPARSRPEAADVFITTPVTSADL